MTSDDIMKSILFALGDETMPIYVLAQKLNRSESNVRRDLTKMAELGLVEKTAIDVPGKMYRHHRVGWRSI